MVQIHSSAPSDPALSTETSGSPLAGFLRTHQIIRAAMLSGLVVIAVILATVRSDPPQQDNGQLLLMIGAAIWLSSMMGAILIPSMVTASMGERGETPGNPDGDAANDSAIDAADISTTTGLGGLPAPMQKRAQAWANKKIIQAAVFEGGAMACLILWFVGGMILLLAFPVVNILAMAATFPTAGGLSDDMRIR